MKIVFDGPELDGRYIPSIGVHAPKGEPVEVPDNIGASLLEQDYWKPYRTTNVDDTVDSVLASVGDDAELAAAALAAERAGKNRSTLVEALEKIVNNSEGA